jgi:hypothetical protein
MQRVRPSLIELRQYVIAPGGCERMVELFDTYFATAQDELGLPILGYFRVVGDPDRLVWLRGFADMRTRPERLGAFYGGPVWAAYGAEAIGLVKGYDNVQLLRESAPGSGIAVDPAARQAQTVGDTILATTYRLAMAPSAEFIARCMELLASHDPLGTYVTDPTPNNFPALPIREGEHLFTWFARASGDTEVDDSVLDSFFAGSPERLVLTPCARSALR